MTLGNSVENNVLNESYYGNGVYILLQLRPFFNEMDEVSALEKRELTKNHDETRRHKALCKQEQGKEHQNIDQYTIDSLIIQVMPLSVPKEQKYNR